MPFINVNAVKDFQTCERLYDYRHLEKMPEKIYSRDIYTEKFETTIKNIIYFFLFKKQGGIVPSYASLLNRWEKMWFPKDTTSYDIITEQHESAYGNIASLTTKAASALLMFYEEYAEAKIIPMAISEDYIVPGKKGYNIEDKFDAIIYDGNSYLIVKILFNYKQSNKSVYQTDFSAMYRGFANRYPSKMQDAKFGYIDILSPNVKFLEFPLNQGDIKSFDYWFDKIQTTKVLAPKRGLIPYCKKCPFDKPCSQWNGWNQEETK